MNALWRQPPRVVLALPAVAGALLLLDEAREGALASWLDTPVLLLVTLGTLSARFVGPRAAERFACLLAPLGLAGSWALMPGIGLYSTASFATFLHWSTKYPNLGPINYEVVAGELCVIAASYIPWWSAFCGRQGSWTWLALQALVYLPVLWRLDGDQLLVGSLLTLQGPIAAPELLTGAVARLVASLSMLSACLHAHGAMQGGSEGVCQAQR